MDDERTGGPGEPADEAAQRAEQRAEDEIIGLAWDDDLPVALGDDAGPSGDPGSTALNDAAPADPTTSADGDDAAATDATGTTSATDATGTTSATDATSGSDPTTGGDAAGGTVGHGDGEADPIDAGEDMGELYDDDLVAGRRNALPRRVESWRGRSATGAIATAIAMGLQQVFEPERRRPAAVAEAPSDPYDDDDPITVDYVPDDAEATTVHVKPWLLQKGEPG